MADATVSVIIASAQSVAKVFVIGAVGYAAVKCKFWKAHRGLLSQEGAKTRPAPRKVDANIAPSTS